MWQQREEESTTHDCGRVVRGGSYVHRLRRLDDVPAARPRDGFDVPARERGEPDVRPLERCGGFGGVGDRDGDVRGEVELVEIVLGVVVDLELARAPRLEAVRGLERGVALVQVDRRRERRVAA